MFINIVYIICINRIHVQTQDSKQTLKVYLRSQKCLILNKLSIFPSLAEPEKKRQISLSIDITFVFETMLIQILHTH